MTKRASMLTAGTALAACLFLTAPASAQPVSIVQPGAPGTPVRVITAAEAGRIANTRYIAADVAFMQMMAAHHQQAVDMAALAPTRTKNPQLLTIAGRITASQKDEVRFMRDWLRERGAPLAMPAGMDHAAMGHGGMNPGAMGGMPAMKGMATPAQLAALAAAKGAAFDRLFLDRMIAHHRGAVEMVEALLKQPGAAFDPVLYQFVTDVSNEQTAEIKRMDPLRNAFTGDPRVDLKAGYAKAGEAISNLVKIASLPRPAGFFDPTNPEDLPPPKARKGVDQGRPAAPGDRYCRRGRVQRPIAAIELRPDRHGVRRRPPVRRQLPRLQHLSPRRQWRADADQLGRLPGRAGRRVGGRQFAADVGRAGPRAQRLRLAGRHAGHQRRALPRPAHLRHQRHRPPAPGRTGPDLPRIAHPFGGQGPRGRRPHPGL